MKVVINPGSGVLREYDEAEALRNLSVFLDELGLDDVQYEEGGVVDGRLEFLLRHGVRRCSVLVPGLPIERLLAPLAPRLYVDGSSWSWSFAIDATRFALRPPARSSRPRAVSSSGGR